MKEEMDEMCKRAYQIRDEIVELRHYAFCRGFILPPLYDALGDIIKLINSLESGRNKL